MGRAKSGDDADVLVPLRGLSGVRGAPSVSGALSVLAESPASPPRERADAARNRERILKAARRLMRRKPLDAICMDAIAEAAGVGKGTLYRRFPDRGALAHALLDEDARLLQDRALAGFDLAPGASAIDHALTLLGELFDFSLDHSSILLAAQSQQRSARYEHPAYTWQRTLMVGHLREAMRRGELAPVDALVTAELMLAGTSPELIAWITTVTDEVRVRDTLIATWRRALA